MISMIYDLGDWIPDAGNNGQDKSQLYQTQQPTHNSKFDTANSGDLSRELSDLISREPLPDRRVAPEAQQRANPEPQGRIPR